MNNNVHDPGSPTVGKGSYLICKKHAFNFTDAKAKYNKVLQSVEEALEKMGGELPASKVVIAIVTVILAIGLIGIEIILSQKTIAATTGIGDLAAGVLGVCFSLLGLRAGHLLSATWETNTFSGRKTPPKQFYGGLALSIIYMAFQAWLAWTATAGGSESMASTTTATSIVIVAVTVFELMVGFLMLGSALEILGVIWKNFRIKLMTGKLKRTSRRTESAWQHHLHDVQTYNEGHGTTHTPGIETEAIREARDYYNKGGF